MARRGRSKNVFVLLRTLADSFCKAYVETALDTAASQLSSPETKTEPDLRPLRVLRHAEGVMQLWNQYLNSTVLPMVSQSVTIRREITSFCNHVQVRVEGKMNALMHRALGCTSLCPCVEAHAECSGLQALSRGWRCASQNSVDSTTGPKMRRCRSSKPTRILAARPAPFSVTCANWYKTRAPVAIPTLSSQKLASFFTGAQLKFAALCFSHMPGSLLLEHLKRFPVSATGGLMLTKCV